MYDLKRNIRAKFRGNMCNNKQVMSDKFKMAAAAILNLLFLSVLVKWSISGSSPLHHCKISFIYTN